MCAIDRIVVAPGVCSASQRVWDTVNTRPCSPCQSNTGTEMSAAYSQGAQKASASSTHRLRTPATPRPNSARASSGCRCRRRRADPPLASRRPASRPDCPVRLDVLGGRNEASRQSQGRAVRRCIADVRVAHAAEPVEALGLERCQADHRTGLSDTVGQLRGAGQRVRAAAGAAEDAELLDLQIVGDRLDIVGRVRDRPAGLAVGPAVTGAVEGDQPDAHRVEKPQFRHRLQPAAWRPVQEENGIPGRIARNPHREPAPIRCFDVEKVFRHFYGGSGTAISPVTGFDRR